MTVKKVDAGGNLKMVTDGHLGGYIEGGDPATQYPEMWSWMVQDHVVRSVIDVGCGDGQAVKYFRDLGCAVLGVDGIHQKDEAIVVHDYETGPWPMDAHVEPCDLVWSCEFVEHVEERFVPNFLHTFALSQRFVLMTHGEPDQPGWHHVNNQTADYWKGALASIGFEFDAQLTQLTRGFASANTSPWNHYRRSGLAFRRLA